MNFRFFKLFFVLFLLLFASYFANSADYIVPNDIQSAPATQATDIWFTDICSNGFTINWTNGDGSARVVFVKQTTTGTALPVDGNTYNANTVFGAGDEIGSTGWFCVFNGTGNSVTITGTSANTAYRAMVCEYNGSAGSEEYNTNTAAGNPENIFTANYMFVGGTGDGYNRNNVNSIFQCFAYSGGTGDGYDKSGYNSIYKCFAYSGGTGDGYDKSGYNSIYKCFAYSGGTGDGYDKSGCNSIYKCFAYSGGTGDGYDKSGYNSIYKCFAYSGGTGDGYDRDNVNSINLDFIFAGGTGDGWSETVNGDLSNEYYCKIWTGLVDDDWDKYNNWWPYGIPVDTDKTLIPTDPFSDPNVFPEQNYGNVAVSNTLRIDPDAHLYVPAGNGLTVYSDFLINGELILKTPNNSGATGSLITEGNIIGTGTVTVERLFTTNSTWQFISVPVNNAQSTMFTNNPVNGGAFNPNFYYYDETFKGDDPSDADYNNWDDFTGMWVYAHNNDDGTTPVTLSPTRGYIVYNVKNFNVNFTGSPSVLNNGDYSVTITYTDNDNANGFGNYYDGWNLIGNPYPSAIDWDDASWDRTYIDNTVYIWDSDAGNYVYYNNGSPEDHIEASVNQVITANSNAQEIPAMQSFFIHAKTTAGSGKTLVISNDARVHSSNDMFKSEQPVLYDNIRLSVEYKDNKDELLIRFLDNATNKFDSDYDAFKMFSSKQDMPQIYSFADDFFPYAINSYSKNSLLDENLDTFFIPIAVRCRQTGRYKINFDDIYFDDEIKAYLEDKYENKIVEIFKGGSYQFATDKENVNDRFRIVFKKNEETDYDNSVQIFSYENNVYVIINDKDIYANLFIFNALGQEVFSGFLNASQTQIKMEVAAGIYLVKLIRKDNAVYTKKLYIK